MSVPYRNQVTEFAAQNKNAEAYDVFINSYQPLLLQVQDKLIELDKLTEVEADDNYESAASNQRAVMIILICISCVALGGMVILALYITKSLTSPISEIESAVTKISEGNLDVTVSYESQDELGKLSDRIRQFTEALKSMISDEGYLLGEMAKGNFQVNSRARDRYVGQFKALLSSMIEINESLSNTLLQINQSSDQVASGSDQVSSGAQAMSQGATEQASSVEELTASINEISSVVQTNSATAEESAAASEELSGQAQLLKNLVGQFRLKDSSGTETVHPADSKRKPEPREMNSLPLAGDKY